ncbi:hypothetical protein NPIL_255521 [Nephila pilipes]|uniref:Secreted protein n=1 Tax=Nephila pilipes TaxID=299642 RepID=A0A8X6IXI9_NEPPI|nr:hypothetical protein NPIL_255521 [Nephila pilipes]
MWPAKTLLFSLVARLYGTNPCSGSQVCPRCSFPCAPPLFPVPRRFAVSPGFLQLFPEGGDLTRNYCFSPSSVALCFVPYLPPPTRFSPKLALESCAFPLPFRVDLLF